MLPNKYKSRLGGLCFTYLFLYCFSNVDMCRPAPDGMVVGFKTKFAISANHH